ncbi:MAG: hypothetical protein EOO32_00195 [Comamonadaceae bacterium]|nr:MAG: hypothetical protein EOO32_00195 [Comamonadaceae bacterium]
MSNYIDAIAMAASQLLPGTNLSEDPTPAWAAGTFAVGDERHVVATHRVYRCAKAGNSAVRPDQDATGWKDMRPTNLWAPFDEYSDTAAVSTTQDIVYYLGSRFCNALYLGGMAGSSALVEILDGSSGASLYRYPQTGVYQLKRPAAGYYDYAFGDRRTRPTLVLRDLPIRSNAVIKITISASAGQRRAIGMISRGKHRTLQGMGWGNVLEDSEVTPKTYTSRDVQPDGRQRITVRGSGKDLRFSVVMPRKNADQAVQALTDLMSRPLPWFVSTKPGFAGLAAFGIAKSSPVRYRNRNAFIDVSVEGYVE